MGCGCWVQGPSWCAHPWEVAHGPKSKGSPTRVKGPSTASVGRLQENEWEMGSLPLKGFGGQAAARIGQLGGKNWGPWRDSSIGKEKKMEGTDRGYCTQACQVEAVKHQCNGQQIRGRLAKGGSSPMQLDKAGGLVKQRKRLISGGGSIWYLESSSAGKHKVSKLGSSFCSGRRKGSHASQVTISRNSMSQIQHHAREPLLNPGLLNYLGSTAVRPLALARG